MFCVAFQNTMLRVKIVSPFRFSVLNVQARVESIWLQKPYAERRTIDEGLLYHRFSYRVSRSFRVFFSRNFSLFFPRGKRLRLRLRGGPQIRSWPYVYLSIIHLDMFGVGAFVRGSFGPVEVLTPRRVPHSRSRVKPSLDSRRYLHAERGLAFGQKDRLLILSVKTKNFLKYESSLQYSL